MTISKKKEPDFMGLPVKAVINRLDGGWIARVWVHDLVAWGEEGVDTLCEIEPTQVDVVYGVAEEAPLAQVQADLLTKRGLVAKTSYVWPVS